jgi:hypothetical protein
MASLVRNFFVVLAQRFNKRPIRSFLTCFRVRVVRRCYAAHNMILGSLPRMMGLNYLREICCYSAHQYDPRVKAKDYRTELSQGILLHLWYYNSSLCYCGRSVCMPRTQKNSTFCHKGLRNSSFCHKGFGCFSHCVLFVKIDSDIRLLLLRTRKIFLVLCAVTSTVHCTQLPVRKTLLHLSRLALLSHSLAPGLPTSH